METALEKEIIIHWRGQEYRRKALRAGNYDRERNRLYFVMSRNIWHLFRRDEFGRWVLVNESQNLPDDFLMAVGEGLEHLDNFQPQRA